MAWTYVGLMKRSLLLALMLLGCGRTPWIEGPGNPTTTQQPLRGCDGQAVVMLEGGRTLTKLAADGTKTTLFTFGAGQAAEEISVSQWDSVNGFTFGAAMIRAGAPNDYTWEYVLVGPDAKVRYTARKDEPHSPSAFLGADGSLAVAAKTGWLVRPDGTITDLGALMPMTPLLPSGELLVSNGEPWKEASPKSIWKDGALRPITLSPYAALHVVGSRVVTMNDGALVSVLDGKRVTLPVAQLDVAAQAAGRFLLLASTEAAVLVDLDAGTARKLSSFPDTQQRYGFWNAGLMADGSVLAHTARGEQLQLQRSTDLGATWSDVGQPMAMGEDFGLGRWLMALERSGTVMTLSMSTGYGHYVNGLQLTSARGTQTLTTGQVYVNGDLAPGAADLSPDGQCAAAWTHEDEETLKLVFIDSAGAKRTPAVSGTRFHLGWFKFLP